MIIRILFLAILLTRLPDANSSEKSDLMAVLTDFIKIQNDPTHVTIFQCWEKSDVPTFLKMVSKTHRVRLQNVGLRRLTYLQPEEYQLISLDLNCENSQKLLEKAQNLNMFIAPFRWLLWGSNLTFNLLDFDFTLNSRIFRITPNWNGYNVTSLYKINNNTIENGIASWSGVRQGFTHLNEYSIGRNRSNLMRMNVTICGVFANDANSVKHIWDYKDREADTITKISYYLTYHAFEMLNGTPNSLSTNTWGYKQPNETHYNGMIGAMQRGDADIGGTPFFVTRERLKVIDYVTITSKARVSFIFRKPPLSYAVNVYVHPFTRNVWVACFGILSLIFGMVYWIVKWEDRTPDISRETDSNTLFWRNPNMVDVVLLEVAAMSQQGSDFEMRSLSGRIATFFLFVILVFFYTAYSANIVVLLQATTNSIKTPKDLFTSRIKLAAEDIPFNKHFLSVDRDPLWRPIYERKMATNQSAFFVSSEEGFEKLRTDFYAFHTENQRAYTIISRTFREEEKCGLSEIQFLTTGLAYIGMRKNSTIKEIIKIKFHKIHESGISKCQLHRFFADKPKCLGRTSNFVSVDIFDSYSAFLLYVAGVIASIGLLILEIFYSKYGAVLRRRRESDLELFPFVN